MNAWQTIAACALAYLLGSISFAWLFARKLAGVDLRTYGSGNLGATNAGRLLGRRWALAIYLLDFAKGFAPVMILRSREDAGGVPPVPLLAGLAAFVGHCFPIWHGFRGGKGVATASGVVTALTPLAAGIVFLVFGLALALSRRVSVGSVSAAIALPIAHAAFSDGTPAASWTLGLYVLLAAAVIFNHRKNIGRLFRGEEPRIGAKKP